MLVSTARRWSSRPARTRSTPTSPSPCARSLPRSGSWPARTTRPRSTSSRWQGADHVVQMGEVLGRGGWRCGPWGWAGGQQGHRRVRGAADRGGRHARYRARGARRSPSSGLRQRLGITLIGAVGARGVRGRHRRQRAARVVPAPAGRDGAPSSQASTRPSPCGHRPRTKDRHHRRRPRRAARVRRAFARRGRRRHVIVEQVAERARRTTPATSWVTPRTVEVLTEAGLRRCRRPSSSRPTTTTTTSTSPATAGGCAPTPGSWPDRGWTATSPPCTAPAPTPCCPTPRWARQRSGTTSGATRRCWWRTA